MSLKLSDLKLTSDELNDITSHGWDNYLINHFDFFLSGLNKDNFATFLLLQGIIYFLSLVFSFPIILLLFTRFTAFSDNSIFIGIIIGSFLISILVNLSLKYQAQKWQSWFKLNKLKSIKKWLTS